ncbi:hypothetical protein GALL_524800 [mine drainage metagenome]|uniref:Uncharacterized protein n=1 Tax=mine drainage metagenome TaxID=410659 RepID=A0A1J5P455_9ZZZZ
MLLGLEFQIGNKFRACNYITANIAKGLAECAGNNVHLVKSIIHFYYAPARFPGYPYTMCIVNNQVSAIAMR